MKLITTPQFETKKVGGKVPSPQFPRLPFLVGLDG
jgi:hypothetical protein